MTRKKVKDEMKKTVVIELVEAKDPSCCALGYKVGDSWEVNIRETSGLCGHAYFSFFPYITLFQGGGEASWKPSDKGEIIRSCPDLRPGFRFSIRKKG